MRRLRQISLVVLTILASLVVLAVLVLYGVSEIRLNRTYQIAVQAIPIPTDPLAIQRGRHLASAATHCTGCHGDNLGGQVMFDFELARITAPNLTSGAGGVGASYQVEDWVRAIRHGVGPDGKPLLIMPSHNFNRLSDQDLGAILAYVRSQPAVDSQLAPFELRPLGRLVLLLGVLPVPVERIDHSAQSENYSAGATAEYGHYLVTIGNCADCHGANLSGAPGLEPGSPPALNLTPGGELRGWSEADFIRAMREGIVPGGRRLSTAMPWELTGQLTDEELIAILRYLQSLPPRNFGE